MGIHFSLPTSPWNGGVVKDGKIVVRAGVALLQVEAHPGQFDDVAGGSNYHPAAVHPMRVLLRLQNRAKVSRFTFFILQVGEDMIGRQFFEIFRPAADSLSSQP